VFNIARDSELNISSESDMGKLVELLIRTGGRLYKNNKAKRPPDARIIYYEVERETYWCHPRDFFLFRISMLDESYGKVSVLFIVSYNRDFLI
tara:strand:+ start:7822 stop:8100 length:279 start_codon:yes stop_codon:yes gene_type:complete